MKYILFGQANMYIAIKHAAGVESWLAKINLSIGKQFFYMLSIKQGILKQNSKTILTKQ